MKSLLLSALVLAALGGTEVMAACGHPVIGWDSAGIAAFPQLTHNRVDVQYHDQCSGEQSTKLYGRVGTTGAFQLLRTDAANSGGWRTYAWTGRAADTTYCFRVDVTDDGISRPSGVRCATTAPSASNSCDVPEISEPVRGWRRIGITVEDRCPTLTSAQVRVYDWPSGASNGTLVDTLTLSPAHANGTRGMIADALDPQKRYCFRAVTSVGGAQTRQSALECTTPASNVFTSSSRTRVAQGVGTLPVGNDVLQGIAFTPWETRRWTFTNRQVQGDKCRSVAVRDAQGNYVGSGSGCFGVELPLREGETYFLYAVNGVSTSQSPATCDLFIDGALFADEVKCGWTMTPVAGLTAGDRLQAVHLPPTGLLPPAGSHPAHTPPVAAMVLLPDRGATGLLGTRGGFIANGAQLTVPAGVGAGMVLTGFSPNPALQASAALSQPLRLLVNDVARADSDGDGLGNALEAALGSCASAAGTTGAIPCSGANGVYDPRDSDGDGIGDGWEVLGRKKPAGMSGKDLPLPYWGANPLHKDIFAEIDYSQKNRADIDLPKLVMAQPLRLAREIWGFGYTNDAVRRDANGEDLQNPDGQPGIAIHFDAGRPAESSADWTIYGDWGGWNVHPAELVPVDTDGDGEPDDSRYEWKDAGETWSTMDQVRYGVFRHITSFGWDANGGNAGWGLSQNISIARNDGTPHAHTRVADLIAHEMGHTLGFGHASPFLVDQAMRPGYDTEPGGGRNCKPLYYSAMNYSYEDQHDPVIHGFADGFSYNQRAMLPRQLIEQGALEHYAPNTRPETRQLFVDALVQKFWFKIDPASGSVDWNRDGHFDSEPVAAGISKQPATYCEDGRTNRSRFSIEAGWGDFETPASMSATRNGNVMQLVYTDKQQMLRWRTVSFDDDCLSSDAEACTQRHPASGSAPVLANQVQGADIATLQDAQGQTFLLAVAIGSDGMLRTMTRAALGVPAMGPQWGIPQEIAGTESALGSPEVVATPGNTSARLGVLFYKDTGHQLWMRRISGNRDALEFGAPEQVMSVGATGAGTLTPVRLDDPISQPAALYSYPHTLSPTQIISTQATKGIHLFVARNSEVRALRAEVDGGAILSAAGSIATGALSEGSKPAPVWVNTAPGDDRSGRLYLFYGAGTAKYARAIEHGYRSGNGYTSAWQVSSFGQVDPGAASGTTLAAVATPTDVEPKLFIAIARKKADDDGTGQIDLRPRPENIENFAYQGYNDWLTFRYTLCKQTAEAFGKVPDNSARIDCRPLPAEEPSLHLP